MQDKHRVFAPDGRCGPSLLPSSNTEQNIVAEGLPNTGILGRAFSIERELTMTPVPVARQRRKFQSPNLPFDYGRRSNSRGFPEYGRSLLRGTRPMPFLYSGRKSKTHGCVEEREGSPDRHSEWGRFLRRRLPHRAGSPLVLRNYNDRLHGNADREEIHDGCNPPRRSVFTCSWYLLTRNMRYEEDSI
jgi:hypothetical protein